MKNNFATYFVLFFLFFSLSCSYESKSNQEKAIESTPVNKDITPNYIAHIAVTGMVCEVNCVSTINKALMEMKGVSTVEIDFNGERDTNMVTVKFDSKLIKADNIKNTIENLNEKQYKVENYVEKSLNNNILEIESEKKETVNYPAKIKKEKNNYDLSNNFSIPNIFDVILSVL